MTFAASEKARAFRIIKKCFALCFVFFNVVTKTSGAFIINLITAVINSVTQKASVFVKASKK